MSNWDDFRFFLAVARRGTLSAAARDLSVNHATVLRRLRALENDLETALFDRRPDGYGLTAAGEDLFTYAERIEQETTAVERRLTGRDIRLTGDVRVSTVDAVTDTIIGPALPEFARLYPGISIELVGTDARANLSRREADVAVRFSNEPGETMVGRRIGRETFGIYASEAYLADHPFAGFVEETPVIQSVGPLIDLNAANWFRKYSDGCRAVLRAASYLTQYQACAAGAGIACLPSFLGGGLMRLQDGPPETETDVWVLTHPELRGNARIRAVLDWLAPLMKKAVSGNELEH